MTRSVDGALGTSRLVRGLARPARGLARVGHQATFVVRVFRAVPMVLRRYPSEVFRLLSDVCWGSGAIVVGGGTIGVMVLLALFTGAAVGIEGYNALDILGLAPLTGFVSALANTRELAPLVASLGFAAQAGCRYTAQLGAKRIADEVDALESMAIEPLPYLVTTRVIAAAIAIVPLYVVGMSANYLATQLVVGVGYGQSAGTYLHYFDQFLVPVDLLLSVLKTVTFVIIATLIHCYFGFYATGGPEGVGSASGRAIRASIITIVVVDMVMTVLFWGLDPNIRLSG